VIMSDCRSRVRTFGSSDPNIRVLAAKNEKICSVLGLAMLCAAVCCGIISYGEESECVHVAFVRKVQASAL